MIELLLTPFIQRALLVGLAVGFLLPFLGVFVTLRKMSFFGDGIAHSSLVGVAIGVIAGVNPFWTALFAGVFFGILIYVLERYSNLSSDVVIGSIFTSSLALGVILISSQGYQPELVSFLFGNILSVGWVDLFATLFITIAILLVSLFFIKKFALISLDREMAWVNGFNVGVLDLFFYIALSVSIVLGVKILGVILVSALLIIPPTIAKLLARSFNSLLLLSVAVGELIVFVGIILSYYLDLPSGATIVLLGVIVLFLILTTKILFKKNNLI